MHLFFGIVADQGITKVGSSIRSITKIDSQLGLIGSGQADPNVSPKLGPNFGEHQSQQNWQKLRQENQQNCYFLNFCEVSQVQTSRAFKMYSILSEGVRPMHRDRKQSQFYAIFFIREGKASPDDKKNSAFCTKFFANFHFFSSFPRAHAGTLQNHSISPCATTVLNNTVESSTIFHSNLMLSTIFHSNLMLCINWFYEI